MNKKDCITFDARSVRRRVDFKPMIHVATSGLCKFTVPATELLGLKAGDAVVFHQGKRDKTEWAIEKADPSVGFLLRQEKHCGRLICNAAAAVKTLLVSLNLTHGQWIPLGTQADDGNYDLITSAVKA